MASKHKKHFQTLKLKPGASNAEVSEAFGKLAKFSHPDRDQSAEAAINFKRVNEAYRALIKVEGNGGPEIRENTCSLTMDIEFSELLVWLEVCKVFYNTEPTDHGDSGMQFKATYKFLMRITGMRTRRTRRTRNSAASHSLCLRAHHECWYKGVPT